VIAIGKESGGGRCSQRDLRLLDAKSVRLKIVVRPNEESRIFGIDGTEGRFPAVSAVRFFGVGKSKNEDSKSEPEL
jgi:hypothetical protein